MRKFTLQRLRDDGTCTEGEVGVAGVTLVTLEEPWKDNKTGVSCIPAGTYRCVPHGWEPNAKTRFKRVYRLEDTTPRVAILIHSGNTTDDIEGCILLGMRRGQLNGKSAVLGSVDAVNLLRGNIGCNSFVLEIKNPPVTQPEQKPQGQSLWGRLLNRKVLA